MSLLFYPQLTSADTLDKLTGMQITDLTLEDNPLCDRFRDTESYIRQVHWVTEPGWSPLMNVMLKEM